MKTKRGFDFVGGENQDNSWIGGMFVRVIIFCLLIAGGVCWLSSCSPRIYHEIETNTKTEYKDTTLWRDSLIYVPVPLGKDQAIVYVGDTSRLETGVAQSIAYIGSDGALHHVLENKKTSLEAVVKIPSRTIWTSVTNNRVETITRTIEVPGRLTWWQRVRLDAFWPLVVAVVLLLLWTFRKLIFKL